MRVPKETILKPAGLARLNLTPFEIVNLSSNLTRILKYCDRLKESKIDPVSFEMSRERAKNVLRDDLVRLSLNTEQALKNALETKDGFSVVPRVIE